MATLRNPYNFEMMNRALDVYDELKRTTRETASKRITHDAIPAGENFDHFNDIPVNVTSDDNFRLPEITTFERANLSDAMLENIREMKYRSPTPIQKHAIPYILAGRDVMGHSPTGSGKTAAFVIPLLEQMLKMDIHSCKVPAPEVEPIAAIILPTRELAVQVKVDIEKLSQGMNFKVRVIYGGKTEADQLRQIQSGCDILVATPGRLKAFINYDVVSMRKCKYLILDEADRMLDLGFGPQIRFIVERSGMMPKGSRQTLLFSATYPDQVQKLCTDFLFNRIFVNVGQIGAANRDILQGLIEVKNGVNKEEKLREILDKKLESVATTGDPGSKKIFVFVERKKTARELHEKLRIFGYSVETIHADLSQIEREFALMHFKTGGCSVLVATSVAARGLDIENVDLVINYDFPKKISEYVQRIGRTGRVGNKGNAVSFFDTVSDQKLGGDLLKILTKSAVDNPDQMIPMWFLRYMRVESSPNFLDEDESY